MDGTSNRVEVSNRKFVGTIGHKERMSEGRSLRNIHSQCSWCEREGLKRMMD